MNIFHLIVYIFSKMGHSKNREMFHFWKILLITVGNMKTPQSLQTSKTWDFHDEIAYSSEFIAGISPQVVHQISEANHEPDWMLELRLQALKIYQEKAFPTW